MQHYKHINGSVAGILNEDGSIDNAPSIKRLTEVAVAYAQAGRISPSLNADIVCFPFCIGCHVIAPSDMMDNRVAAIKAGLVVAGLGGKVYHLHSQTCCIGKLVICCSW